MSGLVWTDMLVVEFHGSILARRYVVLALVFVCNIKEVQGQHCYCEDL